MSDPWLRLAQDVLLKEALPPEGRAQNLIKIKFPTKQGEHDSRSHSFHDCHAGRSIVQEAKILAVSNMGSTSLGNNFLFRLYQAAFTVSLFALFPALNSSRVGVSPRSRNSATKSLN